MLSCSHRHLIIEFFRNFRNRVFPFPNGWRASIKVWYSFRLSWLIHLRTESTACNFRKHAIRNWNKNQAAPWYLLIEEFQHLYMRWWVVFYRDGKEYDVDVLIEYLPIFGIIYIGMMLGAVYALLFRSVEPGDFTCMDANILHAHDFIGWHSLQHLTYFLFYLDFHQEKIRPVRENI